MPPISVWYHGLFSHGEPREIRPHALQVTANNMLALKQSGLADEATEIHTCFNGSEDERIYAELFVPDKSQIVMHGLNSFAENLTIVRLWEWSKAHPGWFILYFHSKSATHDPTHPYTQFALTWANTMCRFLVMNWRQCTADLHNADIVCCHWLWNQADGTQHIPAGNWLWVRSDFVAQLPSMTLRERIINDGIAAATSRFEAEVFWGNGRRPNVIQHLPNGGEGVP